MTLELCYPQFQETPPDRTMENYTMDLRQIYLGLQSQMIVALETQTSVIRHNITRHGE